MPPRTPTPTATEIRGRSLAAEPAHPNKRKLRGIPRLRACKQLTARFRASFLVCGTASSNPFPSSGESANRQLTAAEQSRSSHRNLVRISPFHATQPKPARLANNGLGGMSVASRRLEHDPQSAFPLRPATAELTVRRLSAGGRSAGGRWIRTIGTANAYLNGRSPNTPASRVT